MAIPCTMACESSRPHGAGILGASAPRTLSDYHHMYGRSVLVTETVLTIPPQAALLRACDVGGITQPSSSSGERGRP